MGEAYGWDTGERQVFDAERLEEAAKRLREQKKGELTRRLKDGLLPRGALGMISGAQDAHKKLTDLMGAMEAELTKAGVDLEDLASRSLAAAELARQTEARTRAAARRGGLHPE